MKICYLSQINKKRYLFRIYTFKNRLNSYNNLVADLISDYEDFIGEEDDKGNIDKKIIEKIKTAEKTINFELSGNKVIIPSPHTKRFLKANDAKAFVIMIGLNKSGERINCLIQQPTGRVKSCKYDYLIEILNKEEKIAGEKVKVNHLANMYIRNGKELVLLNGSLDMPIIEIGEKLDAPNLTKENKTLKVEKSRVKDDNERRIIKLMREKGYGNLVDKFNLVNPNYPETTLMFYYTLFTAKKENIVENMLTTQNFDIAQLHEIAYGIQSGVGIKKYADPLIDAEEMNKIRTGLENNEITKDAIPHNKIIKKLLRKGQIKKAYKAVEALAKDRYEKQLKGN